MLSSILPVLFTVLASTGTLSAVTVCVRYYLRYRAERHRWLSAERLAERHGPEVLNTLPQLARELRDDGAPIAGVGQRLNRRRGRTAGA